MTRREGRGEVRVEYAVPPSNCAKVLYYTWKLCSVVFSHLVMISLVVAYCILGAVTFEKLESQHEIQVKQNISQIRSNATSSIWRMTRNVPLLDQTNWTSEVVDMLKDFENAIILEMKVRGWDGSENLDHVQWTFTGALFYSIIVITTIGYGHITPKTQTGKVVTIFYAILGIPLMLLCLSNIGDVMASSFRFLYWRACCYVCTRPPSRRRRRHHSAGSTRRSMRGRPASTRRRAKQLERCYSDSDCRYRDSGYSSGKARRTRALLPAHASRARPKSQPPTSTHQREYERENRTPTRAGRYIQEHCFEEEEFPKISLPLRDLEAALKDLDDHQKKAKVLEYRSKSLPKQSKFQPDRDWDDERHYELDEAEGLEMHDLHDVDYENYKERKAIEERERKRREREECEREDDCDPDDDVRRRWDGDCREPEESRVRAKRARSAIYDYERPDRYDREELGRNRRLRRLQTVDDSYRWSRYSPSPEVDCSDEEAQVPRRHRQQVWNQRQQELYAVPPSEEVREEQLKPVPIWLCVLLVASYIVAGTFLFKRWEGWPYLDAAYFCFITLTTIGFGDFVPAQSSFQGHYGEPTAAVHSIALCSLYLLFGIALLAMSFNLVQEEVRANVAALATRLGIIKSHRTDDDTDSDC